jgi:hypothetical protein
LSYCFYKRETKKGWSLAKVHSKRVKIETPHLTSSGILKPRPTARVYRFNTTFLLPGKRFWF